MPDRLGVHGTVFLLLDRGTSPMHVGSLALFAAADAPDHDQLIDLIDARIERLPLFRKVFSVDPLELSRGAYEDAVDFDLTYHVRRSALPSPGGREQLDDLLARIVSRPLERSRPLWEIYLIEGLEGGCVALLSKTHQAIVGGFRSPDLLHVLLDDDPDGGDDHLPTWVPRPQAGAVSRLAAVVLGVVNQPGKAVANLREAVGQAAHITGEMLDSVVGFANPATKPRGGLFKASGTGQRRVVLADIEFAAVREMRDAIRGAGGAVTAHDVLLALLCGVLRSWLSSRGTALTLADSIRALVPVSMYPQDGGGAEDSGESTLSSHLIDLPIGEVNPRVRLVQIARQTLLHRDGGRAVDARSLARLSGFAPPTLHAMGLRAAASTSRRLFELYITNAPGPQHALYLAGHRLQAMFPIPALMPGQALGIGVTSYDGRVFFGFCADRDAVPDLEHFPQFLEDARQEILEYLSPER